MIVTKKCRPIVEFLTPLLVDNNRKVIWNQKCKINTDFKNLLLFEKSRLIQSTLKLKQNYSLALDESEKVQGAQKTSIYLIKHAADQLLKIDPILLDEIGVIFGSNYISPSHLKNKKENQLQVISLIQEYNQKKLLTLGISSKQVFEYCRIVYEFLICSKVGFLRGDLHNQTFFYLSKDIESKIKLFEQVKKKKQIQYQKEDFLRLFNLVTDPSRFRLPLKGIYKRQLESKINLYQRQVVLEEVSSQASHDKFQQILDSLMNLSKVQEVYMIKKFIVQWLVPLTVAIHEEQKKCIGKELSSNRKIYAPYLVKIEAEKIAIIALNQLIIEIFEQIYRQGPLDQFVVEMYEGIQEKKYVASVMQKLSSEIAIEREIKIFKETQKMYDQMIKNQNLKKQPRENKINEQDQNMDMVMVVENEIQIEDKQKKVRNMNWKSESFVQKQKHSAFKYVHPMQRKQLMANLNKNITLYRKQKGQIPENVQQELGKLLVFILKELIKIKNKYQYKVPLLILEHTTVRKNEEFISNSIIRVNQEFLQHIIPKIQKNDDIFLHMERSVPTIIEPLAWLEPDIGGYYSQATSFMRYSQCPVQERIVKYADNHRIFSVLDYLSSTPWKVNQKVLSIMQDIWAQGGDKSYIPKRHSEHLNTYKTKLKHCTDSEERKILNKKIKQIRDQYSLRGDFNLKLCIARSFANIDYFFFPHNVDFRGRVYPIPPHLNHIGHDLARGLLQFGVGKKLGKGGLRWLKIHTANLMGKDKAPINQKLIFIEENLGKIHVIARQPLLHREWLDYEDCWQAISSIMDLSNALNSGNPEEYISHLHIHQDGSCNGLQHYAALGRDIEGAHQVNLGPGQKPSDIYTHVSKMVIKMIQKDIQGQESAHHLLAKKLPDNIKRKTIKQTVMTSVYGVTFIGARQQIYRQLRDQHFLTQDEAYQASLYVAKLTLQAISNLFTGAHQIKKWFRTCANLVSKSGNPLGWISPIGLPIVQPYRKLSRLDYVHAADRAIKIPRRVENIPINVQKQTSAFPPNYVHSLDSAHMMYTAEICKQRFLTFAAVHDSYWTHAGSVDQMNEILRQQFIKLHKQPLLQNFKNSLQTKFPQINFPQIPIRGNFDLQKIKQSLYFFS